MLPVPAIIGMGLAMGAIIGGGYVARQKSDSKAENSEIYFSDPNYQILKDAKDNALRDYQFACAEVLKLNTLLNEIREKYDAVLDKELSLGVKCTELHSKWMELYGGSQECKEYDEYQKELIKHRKLMEKKEALLKSITSLSLDLETAKSKCENLKVLYKSALQNFEDFN